MQETPTAEKKAPIVQGKGLFSKPTPVPTVLVPAMTVPAATVPAVPVSGEGLDCIELHWVRAQCLAPDSDLGLQTGQAWQRDFALFGDLELRCKGMIACWYTCTKVQPCTCMTHIANYEVCIQTHTVLSIPA